MADQPDISESVGSKLFRVASHVGQLSVQVKQLWDAVGGSPGSGGSDASFVFAQTLASAVWQVQHNLAKYPAVTVVDSSGHEVIGDVVHNSSYDLTIQFSAPFAGSAYLN